MTKNKMNTHRPIFKIKFYTSNNMLKYFKHHRKLSCYKSNTLLNPAQFSNTKLYVWC